MDFIFDNFQIVILIAGGIAYFLNNYRQAKEAERQARDEPPVEYEDVFGPDFDFGETHRQGEPSLPPPVVITARPPPLPVPEAVAAVTVSANERELHRQQQLQDRLAEFRRSKSKGREGALATRTRVAAGKPGAVVIPVSTSLRSRLRNKGEVRRAIVLREILGPPVAFK